MDKVAVHVKHYGFIAYNHKFKLLFFLLFAYGAKKCYDLYKFIAPFLKMKNQLMGGGGSSNRGGGLSIPQIDENLSES